jgi:hypothetical protein
VTGEFSAGTLVARACEEAGLGGCSWARPDGLGRSAAAAAEADLGEVRPRRVHQLGHRRLVNRLQVIDGRSASRKSGATIARPIVVLGMLRTGTTLPATAGADPRTGPS